MCKSDCVIVAKCKGLKIFNKRTNTCELPNKCETCTVKIYDESNGKLDIPDCFQEGVFPVPSNCSYYFTCRKTTQNYMQKVYKCKGKMQFNVLTNRCSYNAKCTPTQTTTNKPDPFPPCRGPGVFRFDKFYT